MQVWLARSLKKSCEEKLLSLLAGDKTCQETQKEKLSKIILKHKKLQPIYFKVNNVINFRVTCKVLIELKHLPFQVTSTRASELFLHLNC